MKKLMILLAFAGAFVAGCGTGTSGRGAEIVTCSAGMDITIGCGALGLGTCSGDPILNICDPATASTDLLLCDGSGAAGYIDSEDDTEGRCPGLTVTCPASGQIIVRPEAFSGTPTCNWTTRVAGP